MHGAQDGYTVREEDESDRWRTSFFTQRTADSSFWDLVWTLQLSISECLQLWRLYSKQQGAEVSTLMDEDRIFIQSVKKVFCYENESSSFTINSVNLNWVHSLDGVLELTSAISTSGSLKRARFKPALLLWPVTAWLHYPIFNHLDRNV